MENKDIRWIQRFNNYRKALARLTEAVDINVELMSTLEKAGLIQLFEMTYELAWKTLQDFLRDRGNPDIAGGPAVIIAKAIEEGYIKDEESWKELKKSREMTSHTYDEATANEIAGNIVEVYHSLFIQLETRLQLEKINQEKQG
jgi:nucleotidyltransferase substrate binding protein (TIGR01987 family)